MFHSNFLILSSPHRGWSLLGANPGPSLTWTGIARVRPAGALQLPIDMFTPTSASSETFPFVSNMPRLLSQPTGSHGSPNASSSATRAALSRGLGTAAARAAT